jgi:WD40 repeat protein
MASRGRTFLQEIRDAIEAVDRVVAVVGPGAIHSKYVRYEWEHALLFAKSLLPILRLGDFDLVPSELSPEDDQGLATSDLGKLHCPDFRAERPYGKAFNELVAIIRQPVPPLASYDGTPALPPHFLPRRDDLRLLKERILADVLRPVAIASAKQTVALQGMGGVGKSVLAAAFARAISTRRVMEDGILWLSAGQDATRQTLLDNMKAIGTACGGVASEYLDEMSARRHLPKVLENKTCLIILDDVWSIEQVEPFRDAIGPRCRLLITTREGSLVTALDAQEQGVDVLSDRQALALLADWSGHAQEALPETTRQVATECGNLPLALALCGAMARDGTPWADLLDALREADLTYIEANLPRYAYPNVLGALRVSVDMLGRDDQTAVGCYHDLAVFPTNASVPEAALLNLWCREREISGRSSRKVLTNLSHKALLTVQGNSPDRQVSLHPLQHDYLRAVAGERISTLHSNLIEAYRSQCAGVWHEGRDDGYFFQNILWHMHERGTSDDIRQLLFDPLWLRRKLAVSGVGELIRDCEYLPNDQEVIQLSRALRLSFHVLDQQPGQLWAQLCGRLTKDVGPCVAGLLSIARMNSAPSTMLPITDGFLDRPGATIHVFPSRGAALLAISALPDGRVLLAEDKDLLILDPETMETLRVLDGHSKPITAVRVLPDGDRALSASTDGTLRVWDLEAGETLRTIKSYGGIVFSLTPLSDGRHVLIGSEDFPTGYRPIWFLDLETAEVLGILRTEELGNEGYDAKIYSLAALPDLPQVLLGYGDGTLRLMNFKTREIVNFGRIHSGPVYALALLPGGQHVLSGSYDRTLHLFDLMAGKVLRTFKGHSDAVTDVAVLPGGREALTISHDKTLRLWDLEVNEPLSDSDGHDGAVLALAMLPRQNLAVSAATDGTLRLWRLETGQTLRRLPTGDERLGGNIAAVAVLPSGRHALSGAWSLGFGRGLQLWDLQTGELLRAWGSEFLVSAVQILPGERALSDDGTGSLLLWDLETAGILRHLIGPGVEAIIRAIAVLPNGKRALTACLDKKLRLWDLETGEVFRVLKGHRGEVMTLALLPDGRRALSGSEDNTLRLWDLETGATLRVFKGHRGRVRTVAVLSNGRHAFSGSEDRTLRLWDLETRAELACFVDDHPVCSCSVSLDDTMAVAGNRRGRVLIFDVGDVLSAVAPIEAQ